jgi:superfamily II DNA/RNA helicase
MLVSATRFPGNGKHLQGRRLTVELRPGARFGRDRGSHAGSALSWHLARPPTRELVIQIGEALARFAEQSDQRSKVLAVYGGVKLNPQMMALRGGVDVLVATPGRMRASTVAC